MINSKIVGFNLQSSKHHYNDEKVKKDVIDLEFRTKGAVLLVLDNMLPELHYFKEVYQETTWETARATSAQFHCQNFMISVFNSEGKHKNINLQDFGKACSAANYTQSKCSLILLTLSPLSKHPFKAMLNSTRPLTVLITIRIENVFWRTPQGTFRISRHSFFIKLKSNKYMKNIFHCTKSTNYWRIN